MKWFEDESLWRRLYPFLFHQEKFAAADKEIDLILQLTGITGGAALDLCCGPGRHSAALARKGFAVTAVDGSAFLLEKARDHATGLPVEFVQSDMRRFVRDGAFDLIVNLFTSFGYFETAEEDVSIVGNLFRSLLPGGALVMDLLGKELVAAQPCSTLWVERDGEVFVNHHEVLPDWSRVRIDWLLVRADEAARFELLLKLYSGEELRELLTQAGFRDVRLFGNFDGTDYNASAKRLIAVGSKPAS